MSRLYAECLCVFLTSPAWGEGKNEERFREVAERMVKGQRGGLRWGETGLQRSDAQGVPRGKVQGVLRKEISANFGKINRLESPKLKSAAEAVFVAHCDRHADITLILDDQGRVAGMLFRPAPACHPPEERNQTLTSLPRPMAGFLGRGHRRAQSPPPR